MLLVSPVWMIEPAMGWNYMTIAILIAVLGGPWQYQGDDHCQAFSSA